MFLTFETIITLAEDQVSHDVVRQPVAPLAHISWYAPSSIITPYATRCFLLRTLPPEPSAIWSE